MDRWMLLEVLGAASLCGGVLAQWGPAWAAMALGALLLGVSGVRAWNGRRG